ncbi:PREDICTED: jerky protein homolog-like [Habropoda laboriosa]|uniref:jerky protein homolog-like n=1 Tax=Habropoda laboriosa TaxID=597456 RepID=UPI00083D7B89|nr:PREDICTED: jerky protein homolog-like [Habropoda laboriosa]
MAANSTVSSKQISIEKRLEILNKLEAGVSVNDLAREYNVTDRSIRRIRQNVLSIRQFAENSQHLTRKRIRTSTCDDFENQLYSWFLQRCCLGDRITDNILLEKAKELQKESGPPNFTPNRGWLWRFKKNYNLRLVDIYGESATENIIEQFSQILEESEISENDLYNMDETSLFWNMLPNKTLVSAREKRVPDRITLGLCTNASGNHKLPPIFINKYENPRALKHCKNNLPVFYAHQKNAWMNNTIFLSCGHIVSDNQMDDDQFKIMFLLPNTSSLIQPMEQGIISKCKKLFRHKLLQRALKYNGGIPDFYGDYDIKDCIDLVNESWGSITAVNIYNAWNKIFNRTRLIHSVTSLSETVTHSAAYETISDEEVKEWIDQYEEVEIIREDAVEEEEESSNLRSPSPIEAEEIDRFLHYLEKIRLMEPEIANHAQSIINYYNSK